MGYLCIKKRLAVSNYCGPRIFYVINDRVEKELYQHGLKIDEVKIHIDVCSEPLAHEIVAEITIEKEN